MKTRPKNAIGEWKLPSECLACEAEDSYARILVKSEKVLRGETFTVEHNSWRCRDCGEGLLGPKEMDEAMRAVTAAYQEAHELLTAEEIKKLRKRKKVSQAQLAELSGLGSASIKRWESGVVLQTETNDDALRSALKAPRTPDPIDVVEERLVLGGIDKAYFRRVILPSSFSEDSANTPGGLVRLMTWIRSRTGFSPSSFFDADGPPQLALSMGARYKRATNVKRDELDLCEAICGQFAVMVAALMRDVEPLPLPDADELRAELLEESEGPGVSFESVVKTCWSYGIAVVHISNFPKKCKKPEAMALLVEGRPVIVITKITHSAAWMIFYLLHEMGHFHHGHVTGVEPLVDRKLELGESEDPEEQEANLYAAETILGGPRITWPKLKMDGQLLAQNSRQLGKKYAIAPSAMALSYAYQEKKWSVANAALKQLEKAVPDPIETIHRHAKTHLEWMRLSKEDREWFEVMTTQL